MPNWCCTNIKISCNEEKEARKLFESLEKWTSKNYKENGFGKSWLGNVVLGSGIGTVDTDEKTDIHCRGSITYMDIEDKDVLLTTETAWVPMLSIFYGILSKYDIDADIIYTAEEPGCLIYATNDPDLIGKFHVYVYEEEDEALKKYIDAHDGNSFDADKEEITEMLQYLLKTNETNLDKLLEKRYGNYVSINEWSPWE